MQAYYVFTPYPHSAWRAVLPSVSATTTRRDYRTAAAALRVARDLAAYGVEAHVYTATHRLVAIYYA